MGGRGNRRDVVLDIIKPSSFTGGLEFSTLTYTVTKKEKDEDGKWSSKEVDLLHRVTGTERSLALKAQTIKAFFSIYDTF